MWQRYVIVLGVAGLFAAGMSSRARADAKFYSHCDGKQYKFIISEASSSSPRRSRRLVRSGIPGQSLTRPILQQKHWSRPASLLRLFQPAAVGLGARAIVSRSVEAAPGSGRPWTAGF